jgi:hypothetical protein
MVLHGTLRLRNLPRLRLRPYFRRRLACTSCRRRLRTLHNILTTTAPCASPFQTPIRVQSSACLHWACTCCLTASIECRAQLPTRQGSTLACPSDRFVLIVVTCEWLHIQIQNVGPARDPQHNRFARPRWPMAFCGRWTLSNPHT